jgi:hypothetical protein
MYRVQRIGTQWGIVGPDEKLLPWSTYNRKEAEQRARELDLARAMFFQMEEV